MGDKQLCKAIAEAPQQVGFPGALALGRLKLAPKGAAIDLALFPDPRSSAKRLVIVEGARDEEGIGRILIGYAQALAVGERAIEQFRTVARAARDEAARPRKMSYKRVLGTWDRDEARELLATGRPLKPEEVALIVAMPEAEGVGKALRVAAVLRKHHRLDLRLALVDGARVRLIGDE